MFRHKFRKFLSSVASYLELIVALIIVVSVILASVALICDLEQCKSANGSSASLSKTDVDDLYEKLKLYTCVSPEVKKRHIFSIKRHETLQP